MKRIDLTGQIFGRLTVFCFEYFRRYSYWRCKCECGNEKVVAAHNLKQGNVTSCGCLRKEKAKSDGIKNFQGLTHGGARRGYMAPEYKIWIGIKARCYNPKATGFFRYGGRGIKMCDQWLNNFDDFRTYIGPRPSKIHSVDRYPNTNGNYEPGNVRWATPNEQARNLRNNVALTYDGKTLPLMEWAKLTGLSEQRIYHRVYSGWSDHDALTAPVNKSKVRHRS